jgi:hypothetical protein
MIFRPVQRGRRTHVVCDESQRPAGPKTDLVPQGADLLRLNCDSNSKAPRLSTNRSRLLSAKASGTSHPQIFACQVSFARVP